VNETPTLVLDLRNFYPVAFVFVTGRPNDSVDIGAFPTGEGYFLPFGSDDTAHHDHALLAKPV